jgi:cytochrome c biogenesis protein CcmG/thiol:disulfide interchange protein DsbE
MSTATENNPPARSRRFLLLLPLAIFLGLAALFLFRLGAGDISHIPSALIGRPVPAKDFPPVPGLLRDGVPMPGVLHAQFIGEVTLVNVWASWCIPCREEAPLLMRLAQDKRIRLVGINYKDRPENARRFINAFGNPYAASGADEDGRLAFDWGVYGVPETFLVGRDGRVAFKLIGQITPQNLEMTLKPEIERALSVR